MFPIQFRHKDLDISDNDLQQAVLRMSGFARILSFSSWQYCCEVGGEHIAEGLAGNKAELST